MKQARWNGSHHQAGAPGQFGAPSTLNSRKPRLLALRPCCDQPVVSLAVYKAQRRRAVLAAQANARRRTVICLALCLLGLVAGVVARERDAQIHPAVVPAIAQN